MQHPDFTEEEIRGNCEADMMVLEKFGTVAVAKNDHPRRIEFFDDLTRIGVAKKVEIGPLYRYELTDRTGL